MGVSGQGCGPRRSSSLFSYCSPTCRACVAPNGPSVSRSLPRSVHPIAGRPQIRRCRSWTRCAREFASSKGSWPPEAPRQQLLLDLARARYGAAQRPWITRRLPHQRRGLREGSARVGGIRCPPASYARAHTVNRLRPTPNFQLCLCREYDNEGIND